jgi:hypothetical protein
VVFPCSHDTFEATEITFIDISIALKGCGFTGSKEALDRGTRKAEKSRPSTRKFSKYKNHKLLLV